MMNTGSDREQIDLSYAGVVKLCSPLEKQKFQFLKKLSTHLPYGTSIPLLGVYSRQMKAYVHTTTSKLKFIAA